MRMGLPVLAGLHVYDIPGCGGVLQWESWGIAIRKCCAPFYSMILAWKEKADTRRSHPTVSLLIETPGLL